MILETLPMESCVLGAEQTKMNNPEDNYEDDLTAYIKTNYILKADVVEAIQEYTHYHRTCNYCGRNWWALHCPHDGIQNRCPSCNKKPKIVTPGRDCDCEFVAPIDELMESLKSRVEQ